MGRLGQIPWNKGRKMPPSFGRKVSRACKGRRSPNFKHGLSGTREHQCWRNILSRCYWKTDKDFPNYGGRGIIMCERWRKDFLNFYRDMGKCPPGFTIQRKDNDGNYEPGNCCWVPRAEQYKNKRNPDSAKLPHGKDHWMWGRKTPHSVRRKISESRLRGIAEGRIIPWNKGKPGSQISWNTGRKMPLAFGRKISRSCKGRIPWNKGKKAVQKGWNKGKHWSVETRIKISKALKGRPSWVKQREQETLRNHLLSGRLGLASLRVKVKKPPAPSGVVGTSCRSRVETCPTRGRSSRKTR